MTTTAVVSEDRTQFIGASDVAAVLGVDPYRTRLQVWEEKVGIAEPFAGNRHTRRGTRLEEVAAEVFSEETGMRLQRVNRRITSPRHPFIATRIDRRVVGEQALAEFKCPTLGSFGKMKREGLHEGYIAQMQTMLGLTGYLQGYWAIFCADQWEQLRWPVDYDLKLFCEIEERLAAFWHEHVLTRVAPPATEVDEERIELARLAGEVTVTTRDEPEFQAAVAMYREARDIHVETEAVLEEAKARVKDMLAGVPGVYVGPGYRLNYIMTKGRASFDQKALAAAKPLDRLKVGALLQPLLDMSQAGSLVESTIQQLGTCELDLKQFTKTGAPFLTLRPTFPEVGEAKP